MRALPICSLYNIASFRRLCSAISENIAYRWFCFLTIDDPVFDHSSISHFIIFHANIRGGTNRSCSSSLIQPQSRHKG